MSTSPPTQPVIHPAAQAPARPQSTWPTVIGIITIIIGSLGAVQYVVCAPISWVMMGFVEPFMDQAAQSQPGMGLEVQKAQFEAMHPYMAGNIAVSCAAGVLAIMLLVAGIGLVRRRPWTGGTLVAWAVLKIVLAIPAVLVGYFMQVAMFEAMKEAAASAGGGPGAMPPGFYSLMATFGLAMAIISLLFYWALPVFVLIWFSRARIRSEMAGWRTPA